MKKRSHRNTPRLTARERARVVAAPWKRLYPANGDALEDAITRAIGKAVREALARKKRRAA